MGSQVASMFKPNSVSCFSDPAAVRELASAGERLVCLQFPDELGSLYCHSFVLSSSSSVLRNVLEDTQQQKGELCTIPLAGDSDVSVWSLALGLIYGVEAATVTLDNAQALLLLAHKYDMARIIGERQLQCWGVGCTPKAKRPAVVKVGRTQTPKKPASSSLRCPA
jgi:hypothetical protein